MANEVQKAKTTGLKAFNQTIQNPNTQKYLESVLGERKGSFVNNLVNHNTKSAVYGGALSNLGDLTNLNS